jgi:hypothetical protein
MEHFKEHSLPRPYTPAPDPDETPQKSQLQLHPDGHKLPRFVVWIAAVLAASIIGGAIYLLYCAATGTVPGTNTKVDGSTGKTVLTPTADELKHSYGIAAGGSLGDLSDKDLDQRMADIAATGAKWVRFDFNWSLIQPDSASQSNWGSYDKLVNTAQKHGLYILGILDFTPKWARADVCSDSDKCYPADNQKFADFAKTVASRYKDHGLHYWEVWNEPNNPQFWQPAADPAGYTQLLQAAAKGLRAIDKDAYIITAGLSPQETNGTSYSPIDFLTALYKDGAKGSFDAVADHPYTFPLSPKTSVFQAWNQMADPKNSLRQVMLANGDQDKKIWITEYGSPTGGPGPNSSIDQPNLDQHPYKVDEALQAKLLSDAVDLYKSYNWVGPFMYYSYQDAGTTQDTNENFFGLVRADGSKKPAYQVFHDAATGSAVK